jgi:acetyltransferase
LIGATEAEGSIGRTIMENLMDSGNRAVYPVNPHHESVLGVPTYASIADVPERVDLVVVATPAATVPDVLSQCVAVDAKGAIVVSAGFGETGPEGKALEQEVRDVLARSKMRMIGPNCLGVIRPSVGLNASFLKVKPEAGNIALISQSGALGTGMLDWATSSKVGFSLFASVGGMVNVDFADLIDFLGEDPYTRSILIYMETIGDARRFMSAARGFARNKPIIILKPGKYFESARAALSHTGAMAGGDEVYEAAFRRAGAVRVREVSDLFRAAEVLDSKRLPTGASVAIVTNAGGLGVMATDALVGLGGRLAKLSEKSMRVLDDALPPYWSHNNPIDVLGDAGSERFVVAVEAALADEDVAGLLVIYTPQGNSRSDEIAEKVSALAKNASKPVITVLMGGESVARGREIFQDAGIPCYETPEDAVRTYIGMYRYARNLELLYETPAELAIDAAPPRHNLEAMLHRIAKSGRFVLTEEESKRFLTTYGIPVIPQRMARTVGDALSIAERIGYPVVLKVVSPDVTHKNAVGGVELGICSPKDLEAAYARIMERVSKAAPEAKIDGIAVQQMVRSIEYELILGMKKDLQFGSVIVFGAGGITAEGQGDFAVSLPPLNQVLARRMMEETRVYRTMSKPPRGVVPPDFSELEEMLTVLSNVVIDFPEIAEIDINPVVVTKGHAVAVDARIVIDEAVLNGTNTTPHLVITPYPTRYVEPWRLKDGTEVLLRPIRPEDEPMIGELLETVSEETLRSRFFGNVPVFDHDRLVRFTNIDYDREIAIIAELTTDERKRIVGVGRLNVDHEGTRGEFAALVHDEFQGRGLGYKLTDVVIGLAQDKGLECVEGYISCENRRMIEVSESLGFSHVCSEDGVATLRLDLT